MPQSLSHVIIHLVFSTKNRHPFITKKIRDRLYPYIAQVIREHGSECYRVGGVEDHVHLAIRLSKTETIAKVVSLVKTSTSKWLKGISPSLEKFAWQEGYGAFSISPKGLDALLDYIDHQEEHHAKTSFQDEFRKFLNQYGIDFDEKYVWG